MLSTWLETGDPLEELVGAGAATRAIADPLDVEPLAIPVSDRGTRALAEKRRERFG